MRNGHRASGLRRTRVKLTIKIPPRTKKNSQRIVMIKGRPVPLPSKEYVAYEKACAPFIPRLKVPISEPVEVKMVYYMPTRRRVDMVNLQEATLDILVKYGVLADDNRNIVYSQDGSRVFYSKENPRTEITIEPITEDIERWKE